MTRIILPEMLKINRRWETCQLKSYKDKEPNKYHAGWGTGPEMAAKFGITIDEHTVLTQGQADELHSRSLEDFYAPELEKHLVKAGIETNDYEFNALLDVYYNRGGCRLIGCDSVGCGHKQGTEQWHAGSYAWHWMLQKDDQWFMKWACQALVISMIPGFSALNEAYDKDLGHDRVYLGLTLRRIDDASLFQAQP